MNMFPGRRMIPALLSLAVTAVLSTPLQAKVFKVDTRADAVDVNPGDGECRTAAENCSLRAAIQEANALPGPDEAVLKDKVYYMELPGDLEDSCTTGDLDILDDLTITGRGRNRTRIDGSGLDRVIHVIGAAVDITGVTIHNGLVTDNGGGIRNDGGKLTLKSSALLSNRSRSSSSNGGAITNRLNGTLKVKNCLVSNNIATGFAAAAFGGGIYSDGGPVTIVRSTFTRNSVSGITFVFGGGIYNVGGTLTIRGSTVADNSVSGLNNAGAGGGLYSSTGPLTIKKSTISGNLVLSEISSYGGGIFNSDGEMRTIKSKISYNSVSGASNGYGGGIYSDGNLYTLIKDTTVSRNSAGATNLAHGGGVFCSSDSMKIAGSTITGNTAMGFPGYGFGGGLLAKNAVGAVIDTAIMKNTASGLAGAGGGGVHNVTYSLTVDGCTVSANTVSANQDGFGGGLYNDLGRTLNVENHSRISRNFASDDGGGVHNAGGTVDLATDTVMSGNIPNNKNW